MNGSVGIDLESVTYSNDDDSYVTISRDSICSKSVLLRALSDEQRTYGRRVSGLYYDEFVSLAQLEEIERIIAPFDYNPYIRRYYEPGLLNEDKLKESVRAFFEKATNEYVRNLASWVRANVESHIQPDIQDESNDAIDEFLKSFSTQPK